MTGTKKDSNNTNPNTPVRKESGKRRSSLFTSARFSFVRSGGERGASVEVLRGTTGADFEATARVHRSNASGISCGCFGGGGEGDKSEKKERFVLIKGNSCFVFSSKDSSAPKYAISLAHLKAETISQSGEHSTVHLVTSLGDVQYKFIFNTSGEEDVVKAFTEAVYKAASTAETEEVRKGLGHDHLINKRRSQAYADEVAVKKVEKQPEAPTTAVDTLGEISALQPTY